LSGGRARGCARRSSRSAQWLQRIRSTLFHYGIPAAEMPERLLSRTGRAFLARVELPEAAHERIMVALAVIDALDVQLAPIERRLRQLARRQPGCQALMREPGLGELIAPTLLCELGDVTRLSSSRKAVRSVGLDVGVHRSDRRSRVGKLTKQGSPVARWALYEAAQSACQRAMDRPRFGGQRLVRRLVVLSFSRSRSASGSRVSSGA
jgi:transposase